MFRFLYKRKNNTRSPSFCSANAELKVIIADLTESGEFRGGSAKIAFLGRKSERIQFGNYFVGGREDFLKSGLESGPI